LEANWSVGGALAVEPRQQGQTSPRTDSQPTTPTGRSFAHLNQDTPRASANGKERPKTSTIAPKRVRRTHSEANALDKVGRRRSTESPAGLQRTSTNTGFQVAATGIKVGVSPAQSATFDEVFGGYIANKHGSIPAAEPYDFGQYASGSSMSDGWDWAEPEETAGAGPFGLGIGGANRSRSSSRGSNSGKSQGESTPKREIQAGSLNRGAFGKARNAGAVSATPSSSRQRLGDLWNTQDTRRWE